jgi:hypothetical protein
MTELTTEMKQRIMVEIDLGVPASQSQVPDSPEAAEFRAKVEPEIEAAKAGRPDAQLHFSPEIEAL